MKIYFKNYLGKEYWEDKTILQLQIDQIPVIHKVFGPS